MNRKTSLFDISLLRKGKNVLGGRNRISVTLGDDTIEALKDAVPYGKGLYGSAVIELSLRLLLALVAEDPDVVEIIFSELVNGVKSPYFARNLTKLFRMFMQ